jgi:hypothetical protein
MNLAIHQVSGNLGQQPADTFLKDLHPSFSSSSLTLARRD